MNNAMSRGDAPEFGSTESRHGPLRAASVHQVLPVSKPKLLDQVRDAIRARHYSYRTEEAYVGWIKYAVRGQLAALYCVVGAATAAHATEACPVGTHASGLYIFAPASGVFLIATWCIWRYIGQRRRTTATFGTIFAAASAFVAMGLLSLSAPCVK